MNSGKDYSALLGRMERDLSSFVNFYNRGIFQFRFCKFGQQFLGASKISLPLFSSRKFFRFQTFTMVKCHDIGFFGCNRVTVALVLCILHFALAFCMERVSGLA